MRLRTFTAEQLSVVEPWFVDPATRRWLGGPAWPRRMLELADAPLGLYRGAMETGRYRWLGCDGKRAVGYIDAGTVDRWTTWEGGPGGGGVIGQIPGLAAAITYVVDPRLRGRGYATAMIRSVLRHRDLAHIVVFGAGVEPDNKASVGCLRAGGFWVQDSLPDWEGTVYHLYMRSPGDRRMGCPGIAASIQTPLYG